MQCSALVVIKTSTPEFFTHSDLYFFMILAAVVGELVVLLGGLQNNNQSLNLSCHFWLGAGGGRIQHKQKMSVWLEGKGGGGQWEGDTQPKSSAISLQMYICYQFFMQARGAFAFQMDLLQYRHMSKDQWGPSNCVCVF